eukprot:CAMPEP_0119495800 /NCGR_PEP_ID=MMETSP1344-20130328/19324_1 /TAXON_ID=236787 /ORGANISM="Florenciella parvula, Strain CCMP2471" /LENGTH=115 /DNA_ID=CAMNT_0007531421 /DNA_START=50 /DNA_END=394 /DNA_ORIENTATION=-
MMDKPTAAASKPRGGRSDSTAASIESKLGKEAYQRLREMSGELCRGQIGAVEYHGTVMRMGLDPALYRRLVAELPIEETKAELLRLIDVSEERVLSEARAEAARAGAAKADAAAA